MIYSEFLIAMAQLSFRKKAQITIGENIIFIEASTSESRWKLSTKVFNAFDESPEMLRSCLSSRGAFTWQNQGAYLKRDPQSESIWLMDEVEMPRGKFIPFKYHIQAFAQAADEWKETLYEIAQVRDCERIN